MIRLCAWLAVGLLAGAVLNLSAAWVWLSFIEDGPEFPY